MGAITFSIDEELARRLRDALEIELFVETGTFEGDGVAATAGLFAETHTIELVDRYHEAARRRFGDRKDVHFHHGDSANVLRQLRRRTADRSVLYWLDAHWCVAPGTSGEASECPLLAELQAIGSLNDRSAVLIDDARLFLAPPPVPHDVSAWPSFTEVLAELATLAPQHDVMVVNDVIAVYPSSAAASVAEYARTSGFDLLAAVHGLRELTEERDLLARVAAERLQALAEKEEEIRALAAIAEERLEAIERLSAPPTE